MSNRQHGNQTRVRTGCYFATRDFNPMAHALRHWPRDTSHGHHSAGPPTQEASLSAITGAFKNVDLRKKILFTLATIILYRIRSHNPKPGVDFANNPKDSSG